MDITLLHNPKAGGKAMSRSRVEAALRRAGYRPRSFDLNRALADPSKLDFGEFVVVAGGDGSIRRAALKMIGRGSTLAPLPLGTANNIAHSLGITGSIEDIIAGWPNGRRCLLDIGLASGPWGKSHFLEGVGVGLVGRAIPIIEEIDDASTHSFSEPADKLHRDLCVFIALAHELAPVKIGLALDRGKWKADKYLLLEILNIARAGPQLELVSSADSEDGYLDVVAISEAQRPKLEQALKNHLRIKGHRSVLPRRKARRIRLKLYEGILRIDDAIVWTASPRRKPAVVEISVIPGALKLLVPGEKGRRRPR